MKRGSGPFWKFLAYALVAFGALRVLGPPAVQASAPLSADSSLLQRSLSKMKTLHTVHGEGYLQGSGSKLRISADCVGQVPRLSTKKNVPYSFAYRSWARGTSGPGVTNAGPINVHYIAIRAGVTTKSWQRSSATHGKWQAVGRGQPPINAIYASELCMPLFANSFTFPVHSNWKNEPSSRFEGRNVWKLTVTEKSGPGVFDTTTIYIDRASLYWVHIELSQSKKSHTSVTESFDLSRFNAHIRISAPHV